MCDIIKLRTISLKYLKKQKKHTVFSLIAISLSVAFMTVMLSAISVYRATALNIAERDNGRYHVLFSGVDKQSAVAIRSMDIFSETQIYSVSSYTSSTDMDLGQMREENAVTEYLTLYGNLVDDNFLRIKANELTMLPDNMLSLTEGRLPEKDGEIVISAKSAYMWDYPAVGDTVSARLYLCSAKDGGEGAAPEGTPAALLESFDIEGAQDITFTVVGLSEEYNIVDYSDTRLRSYSYLTDNILARFSDSANDLYWDMHHAFADMGLEIDDFEYGMNQELLDLEGKGVDAKFSEALFFAVAYLCVLFIMFCIRLVIDNAFEISAKERIQRHGLLKAVGASKRQIFSLTVWEAVYLAVPGTVVGMILGLLSAKVIFSAISGSGYLAAAEGSYDLASALEFEIRPYVYITSAVIGVLWVCVSAVATGMRSIKASPVDAMRNAGKQEKLRLPKNPSAKAFGKGFIPAYSSLSIKRSKKRYIITMISMVMSITLFAGFSYGVSLYSQKLEKEFEVSRAPFDYSISYAAFSPYSVSDEIKLMEESGYFTDIRYDAVITLFSSTSGLDISPECELYPSENLFIYIRPISQSGFESDISAHGTVSYAQLEESGGILLCSDLHNTQSGSIEQIFASLPEAVTGQFFNQNEMTLGEELSLSISGSYSSNNSLYYSSGVMINSVTAESTYMKLLTELGSDSFTYTYPAEDGSEYLVFSRTIYANAADGLRTQAENYLERRYYGSYTNNIADMERSAAYLATLRLAGYFVIAVVSLIAAVNIVNIISANVLNRTPELAMLRACGMSDRQLYLLILREGLSYATAAGAISLLITELAVAVIQLPFATHFHDLTQEDLGVELSFAAPVPYILAAAAAAFVIAAAASYFPARRIILSPIVESIHNADK